MVTQEQCPSGGAIRIGLFVTCLADLFRPPVAFAAVKLLEDAGCVVEVPTAQTCCGQPAHNSGDAASARALARNVIEAFEGFEYVIAPSGSCAAMIRVHYPVLLKDDPDYAGRAEELADRTYELTSFLVNTLGVQGVDVKLEASATYHDSCSGLRELGIKEPPRKLLASIEGLELRELAEPNACCGFGGAFSVKYPDISGKIVSAKTRDVRGTGAKLLLGGDLGCLMNIAGRLGREGSDIEVRHVAEVLAGDISVPAIGKEK
jgi:L-lactate dehydrogenase complex protein LldE